MKRKRGIQVVFGVLLSLFLLVQLVPYGRDHTNPPSSSVSPPWDLPRTEELARRVCFDCHSNETRLPWYASVAPISWHIQKVVDDARSELNFPRFDRRQEEAGEAAGVVREGEMPPCATSYCTLGLGSIRRNAAPSFEVLARTCGDEEGEEHSFEMDEYDKD